jgi:hypothetical protein
LRFLKPSHSHLKCGLFLGDPHRPVLGIFRTFGEGIGVRATWCNANQTFANYKVNLLKLIGHGGP